MNECERCESLTSAWLDDELDRADRLDWTDHLVRCGACRGFYLQAREMDGLLAVAGLRENEPQAPRQLWSRIERATARVTPSLRLAWPAWSWRFAAAAALAALLASALWLVPFGPASPADSFEIALGEDPASMSDRRFAELTREVLRADSRYHLALYQVMEQVVRDTAWQETSAEGLAPRVDHEQTERPAESVRRDPA